MTFLNSLKAFTLFTALVSFIVIGIGVIVVQHVSNSEQNYSQVITALQSQQEMDAAKDLIRIDSLQVFSLLYRAKFFEYYSNDGNDTSNYKVYHPIDDFDGSLDFDQEWKVFQDLYATELFFGTTSDNTQGSKFAVYIANKMLGLLYDYSGNFKGSQYFFKIFDYAIQNHLFRQNTEPDITDPNKPTNISELYTRAVLSDAMKVTGTQQFIKLVNCKAQNNCEIGSFYTYMYMNNVSYDQYLKLPRVFIKRNIDNSAMDDAILPRNVITLYLPMRLFGAIAFARQKLQGPELPNVSSVTDGHDIDSVTGCESNISLLDLSTKYADNQDNFKTEINALLSPSVIHENNLFELKVDNITPLNRYFNKLIIYVNQVSASSLKEFSTEKIKSARYDISVTDVNPYFTFGHNANIELGFSGTKLIEENPQIKVIVCSCETPDQVTINSCTSEIFNGSYESVINQTASKPYSTILQDKLKE